MEQGHHLLTIHVPLGLTIPRQRRPTRFLIAWKISSHLRAYVMKIINGGRYGLSSGQRYRHQYPKRVGPMTFKNLQIRWNWIRPKELMARQINASDTLQNTTDTYHTFV